MIEVDGVEMVDVREAARLAGRTPETVRRWVWTGRVTAVKQGTRLLIPRAEILTKQPGEAASAGEATSLRGWAERARRAHQHPSGAGRSARDLVLADRTGRGQPGGPGKRRAGR